MILISEAGELIQFQSGVTMEISRLDAWYSSKDGLLEGPAAYIMLGLCRRCCLPELIIRCMQVSVSLVACGEIPECHDELIELVASSEYGLLHLFSQRQLQANRRLWCYDESDEEDSEENKSEEEDEVEEEQEIVGALIGDLTAAFLTMQEIIRSVQDSLMESQKVNRDLWVRFVEKSQTLETPSLEVDDGAVYGRGIHMGLMADARKGYFSNPAVGRGRGQEISSGGISNETWSESPHELQQRPTISMFRGGRERFEESLKSFLSAEGVRGGRKVGAVPGKTQKLLRGRGVEKDSRQQTMDPSTPYLEVDLDLEASLRPCPHMKAMVPAAPNHLPRKSDIVVAENSGIDEYSRLLLWQKIQEYNSTRWTCYALSQGMKYLSH
ncbi:hypothetical protein GIB67_018687 [Kingdonia uniflora]|uniref:Uncharacterized protein n=1 Tax=Kingdonia uniflora TaxID=39325 RepID=A0A7J7L2B8_9MAGN|nr:hypothetical protein GIB67_018687 [Kingdonia uniflora]